QPDATTPATSEPDEDESEVATSQKSLQPLAPPAAGSTPISPSAVKLPSESKVARTALRTEFNVSLLIGLVGLGVGIGCSLAGYFSGNRLELGLVPIGLLLLILTTAIMSTVVSSDKLIQARIVVCLAAVGAAAGLY